MPIAHISLHVSLPLCNSLKDKRNLIQPFFLRIRRKYNVSIAEMGLNEKWRLALISIVIVCNSFQHLQSESKAIINYIQDYSQQIEVINHKIEFI